MKKITVLMVMAAAAMLIAGSAFAWGGGREGFGKGDKDCPNAKEMRKEMKEELGLTAEQEKQLEANREAHRAEAKAMHDAMKAKKDELKAAIAKPGAARAQVEPIAGQLKALEARMTDKKIDGIFAVKAILTPEQFAKLEAMKGERAKERKGKHGDKKAGKGN